MLATAVVLAPIAFAGNAAGLEPVQPMAVVILGGLVTTAVVNVFVVPVLYFRYGFLADQDSWTDDLFAPVSEQRTTGTRRAPASCGEFGKQPRRCRSFPPCSCPAAAEQWHAYTIEHEPASVATPPEATTRRSSSRRKQRGDWPSRQPSSSRRRRAWPFRRRRFLVDPDGVWWVYTNPEPLVFERHEIGLERRREASPTSPAVRRREPRW